MNFITLLKRRDMMITLRDWLSYDALDDVTTEQIRKYYHCEVLQQYGGMVMGKDGLLTAGPWKPWPGAHKHVMNWCVLDNGKAIGFNENPSRGWGFPVIRYTEPGSYIIFTDVMKDGVTLSIDAIIAGSKQKHYPDYLPVEEKILLTDDCKVNPSNLIPNCAYIYGENLYLTCDKGNIAYIDCELSYVKNTQSIKAKHPEYKSVGGKNATNECMDAGHFGVQLGQHPSIAVEQHIHMNRYGIWRKLELSWGRLLRKGCAVNIKAVFTEGNGGTHSDFWCIRETIDNGEINEYVLTNDDKQ